MTVYLSLIVAVIGAVLYFVATNPKLADLGRISFGCGLLAFLICVCRAYLSVGMR